MNVADERRRLAAMIGLTGLGFAIALSGLVAAATLRVAWGWSLVGLGVIVGVGAQVVFIFGVVRRAGKA